MSAESEKVRSLEDYKQSESPDLHANLAHEIMRDSGRDFGKVGIFISILAIVLLVVMFYGLNQNIAGLTAQVDELHGIRGEMEQVNTAMTGLDQRMGGMEARVTDLEAMPEKVQAMLIKNDLQEMTRKLESLGGQLDEQQSQALTQARELLQQVEAGLGQ